MLHALGALRFSNTGNLRLTYSLLFKSADTSYAETLISNAQNVKSLGVLESGDQEEQESGVRALRVPDTQRLVK